MNNNLITQLISYLTHGWQNPLSGMGQTAGQTGQQLYNTFWGQSPTPTPRTSGQLPKSQITTLPTQAVTQAPTLPTSTPTPQQQQVLGSTMQPQSSDASIFQSMGINPQVGLSVLQAEGGRIGQNNPGNVGAFDSHPTGAFNYPTRQAGVRAAAQTMKAIIQQAGVNSNDPNQQLGALEKHYAGDPKTWKQRSMATGGAGKYFNSWSDFVKSTPTWKQYGGGQ